MKLTLKDVKKRLAQTAEKREASVPTHNFSYYDKEAPLDLSGKQLAAGLWYIPEYIDSETEGKLMETILGQRESVWVPLRGRRLQMWGGTVTPEGLSDPQELPQWVDVLADRLYKGEVFPQRPNHVLINDYQPGEGIMPHTDGPAYYPKVAIVSLGSATMFQFWTLSRVPFLSLLAQPRSLILFTDRLYTDFLHGIEAKPVDEWVTDACGKVYADVAGGLSEIKTQIPSNSSSVLDSDFLCPVCGGKMQFCGGNARGRRVSMTIRIVPPLKSH